MSALLFLISSGVITINNIFDCLHFSDYVMVVGTVVLIGAVLLNSFFGGGSQ